MQKDRQLILAKIETTYGVDASPTPSENSILASAIDISVVGRRLERPVSLQFMGSKKPVNIGEAVKVKFETEVKGRGANPYDVPEIGPLFRACNFTETIYSSSGSVTWTGSQSKTLGAKVTPTTPNGFYYECTHAGTTGTIEPTWPTTEGQTVDDNTVVWTCRKAQVLYTPNSAIGIPGGSESLSIYAYQHDILHKILGARGTFSCALKTGEYGKLSWEFTGIYSGPGDSSIQAGTFDATFPPRFVSANFTLDSYLATIENFNFDVGNKIVKRIDANEATGIKEWMIVNREPKGNIDPEMVSIATKDLWGLWANSTETTISTVVGSAAGNKCVITLPKVIADVPNYADRENWLTLNIPFSIHPSSAGNDEIKMSFQ